MIDDSIILEVVVPLHGAHSKEGIAAIRGVTFAVDEINRKGGIGGVQMRTVTIDSSQPAVSIRARLQQVFQQREPVAVIGDLTSESTLVLLGLLPADEHAPVISLTQRPTLFDDTRPFTLLASSLDAGYAVAALAIAFGWRRFAAATLTGGSAEDIGYGVGFSKGVTDGGGVGIGSIRYSRRLARSKVRLASLVQSNPRPDAIMIKGPLQDGAAVVREIRKLGAGVPVCGGAAWDPDELARIPGADDVYVAVPFSDTNPSVLAFVSTFSDQYGERPSLLTATGYDAVQVAAAVLSRVERSEFAEALEGADLTQVPLLTGSFQFGPDRRPWRKSMTVVRVSGGTVSFAALSLTRSLPP